jgi:hypothetical protein
MWEQLQGNGGALALRAGRALRMVRQIASRRGVAM